ncbi:MAG: hypothetical protein AAGA57_09735 [Planctomycetota bacterium]
MSVPSLAQEEVPIFNLGIFYRFDEEFVRVQEDVTIFDLATGQATQADVYEFRFTNATPGFDVIGFDLTFTGDFFTGLLSV